MTSGEVPAAGSPLSRRLEIVQGHIRSWLREQQDRPVRVVSACAGQGRDLLEVLATEPSAPSVRARLVELDPRNVDCLPQLCSPGATVVWTRSRRAPDITPAIRRWLTEAGFTERAFDAPSDALVAVGVHRFAGQPVAAAAGQRMFEFIV